VDKCLAVSLGILIMGYCLLPPLQILRLASRHLFEHDHAVVKMDGIGACGKFIHLNL
jgi:hypothetical protein